MFDVPPHLRDQRRSHPTSNGVSIGLSNLLHQNSLLVCQYPSTTSARNGFGSTHHVLNLSKPSMLVSFVWLWTPGMSASANFSRFMPWFVLSEPSPSRIDFACRTLRSEPVIGINTMVNVWARLRKPSWPRASTRSCKHCALSRNKRATSLPRCPTLTENQAILG